MQTTADSVCCVDLRHRRRCLIFYVRDAQIIEGLRCGSVERFGLRILCAEPVSGGLQHHRRKLDLGRTNWPSPLTGLGASGILGLSLGLAHARIETIEL